MCMGGGGGGGGGGEGGEYSGSVWTRSSTTTTFNKLFLCFLDVLSQSVISSTPTDTVGESNLYHACGLDNTAWLQLYTRYYVKCFCNKTMQTCSSTAIEGQRSK